MRNGAKLESMSFVHTESGPSCSSVPCSGRGDRPVISAIGNMAT